MLSDQGRGRSWLDVVGTLVRLGLAGIWSASGWLKVIDPDQTYVAVRAYNVMPDPAVAAVAAGLPYLELALGLLVLLGLGTRLVAVLSALVLLLFIAGVAQAWARGLSIDCGCFGGGGDVAPDKTSYGTELLRDSGFLVLAAWLIIRPRTLFALDDVLTRGERQSVGGGGSLHGGQERQSYGHLRRTRRDSGGRADRLDHQHGAR